MSGLMFQPFSNASGAGASLGLPAGAPASPSPSFPRRPALEHHGSQQHRQRRYAHFPAFESQSKTRGESDG